VTFFIAKFRSSFEASGLLQERSKVFAPFPLRSDFESLFGESNTIWWFIFAQAQQATLCFAANLVSPFPGTWHWLIFRNDALIHSHPRL